MGPTLFFVAAIALPGTPPVGMDYAAYDPAHHRLWVPAGNSGNVDVIDTQTGKVTPISGFPTTPSPRPNRPPMGPSSVTIADSVVWIGNRGDNKLCAFDAKTLERGKCIQLAAMPDGVQYVSATRELWVTTPRVQSLTIVDPQTQKIAVLKLPGDPEGYAVDNARSVFYTNLEDKDQTLAIDLKTRKVVSTWSPACGAEGPRGLALDSARQLLLVACTDGAVTLDLAHGGKIVGRIKTGAGVDNLDYHAGKSLLFVASGADAKLHVIAVGKDGSLRIVTSTATAPGARNAVADESGNAYVFDSAGGRVHVIKAAP